jgi:lysophospholipase L1-like esterase
VGALTLEKFLRKGRPADVRRLVVCAGDSTTQGVASADWVSLLHDELRPRGFLFVRTGWGGFLSHSLLLRLDSIIGCRPDVVVVMIGTNDVMATTSDAWRESYSRQDLPEIPTIETYRAWLGEIVRRLRAETSARVALLDLPPIGEDLDGAFNERVSSFNEVIREVAAEHDVEVLPLNARLVELIEESSTASSTQLLPTLKPVCPSPSRVISRPDSSSAASPCAHFNGVAGSRVVPMTTIGGAPAACRATVCCPLCTGQFEHVDSP